MNCDYFGVCGSCKIYPDYEEQLQKKCKKFEELFEISPAVFTSPPSHYRARAEFGFVNGSYSMYAKEGGRVQIERCPIVIEPIQKMMPKLRTALNAHPTLSHKLFRIDFLSGLSGDMLVTLVYHKKLDEAWEEEAKALAQDLGIAIVGRSRGQKRVVKRDYIIEELLVDGKVYRYKQYEGSFTQPNPYVNIKMIAWVLEQSRSLEGDLLELYCGAGNFTLPLAQNFVKVLATEVSKTSIKAARENIALNSAENIEFVRLSSQEVSEALQGTRTFRRLSHIDLDSYNFSTVFVDPPRAGLDSATRELVAGFENIIYISCNPTTLHRDLRELQTTHTIHKMAIFDQFPYTEHLESGVVLHKK